MKEIKLAVRKMSKGVAAGKKDGATERPGKTKTLNPPSIQTQESEGPFRNGAIIFLRADWSVGGDFIPADL